MREIKFRGLCLKTGKWVYGNLIKMDSSGSQTFIFPFYEGASSLSCSQLVSGNMIAVDFATVGQYTGVKDKNGTEIYEGDGLRVTLPADKSRGRNSPILLAKGIVYYEGSSYRVPGMSGHAGDGIRLDSFAPVAELLVTEKAKGAER